MTINIVPLLIALMFGIAMMLLITALARIYAVVPAEDRTWLDPLPWHLKVSWPLIRLLAWHVGERLPVRRIDAIHQKLQSTGVDFLLTPQQYFAMRLVTMLPAVGLAALLQYLWVGEIGMTWLLIAAAGAWFYPALWLRERRAARRLAILKALPVYLDFITLTVEAGLNFTGAINQAVEKGPAGPFKQELLRLQRDLRAGVPRAEALRGLAQRLDMAPVTNLVAVLVQADQTGASLGPILRAQAEQRRSERFQRAEKLALQAPVKLLGPLVMFIFPVTFMIIFFPIVMKFLQSGIL